MDRDPVADLDGELDELEGRELLEDDGLSFRQGAQRLSGTSKLIIDRN
jgi:hypothetical protein